MKEVLRPLQYWYLQKQDLLVLLLQVHNLY